MTGRIGGTAYILGLAGLLPQTAALVGVAFGGADYTAFAILFAFAYGSIILSFLGGIWWGFAVQRTEGQGRLALWAVAPSLIAAALWLAMLVGDKAGLPSEHYYGWSVVALGLSIIATLPIDAHLERNGEVPVGWTRFRAILSLGLGSLTIAAGTLYALTTATETYI